MMKRFLHISIVLTGLTVLLPIMGFAGTPLPSIHEPEGEGVKCVKPEKEMRRNHMNYILHQRDETMHEGIRTETYSLAKCIDCHVEPDENGEIASHKSNEHFCNTCHNYASVQMDCFECHADRPQKYIKRASDEKTDTQQAIEEQLKTVLEDRNTPQDTQEGEL